MSKAKGKIIAVQGPVVDVKFVSADDVPNVYAMLLTHTIEGIDVFLEVAEHLPGNVARCISINSTTNIQRNTEAVFYGASIQIPVGDGLYGRLINVVGQPIDQGGPIPHQEKSSIRKTDMGSRIRVSKNKDERRSFEGLRIVSTEQ